MSPFHNAELIADLIATDDPPNARVEIDGTDPGGKMVRFYTGNPAEVSPGGLTFIDASGALFLGAAGLGQPGGPAVLQLDDAQRALLTSPLSANTNVSGSASLITPNGPAMIATKAESAIVGPALAIPTGAFGADPVEVLCQFGTHVGSTNAAGQFTVPFPRAFPTSLAIVLVATDQPNVYVTATGYALGQFTATCPVVNPYGLPPVGTLVRVNYLAIGA